MAQGFTIDFTEEALEHLQLYRKFERNIILDAIKSQLLYQPVVETGNRKFLREIH